MQCTEPIPLIQVSEIVTVVSEIPIIMVVSEMQTQMVASETVMAPIRAASEIPIQVVSEIRIPMVDSVILHHKQDLIIIISNHSQDITTIMEASDPMIQEVSDLVVASTLVEAASEAVLQVAAE